MNNINLIECLNREVIYLDEDRTLFGDLELSCCPRHSNEERGIAIVCCDHYPLILRIITVYNNYDNFNRYEGNLPEEIEFNYSFQEVGELLISRGWDRSAGIIYSDTNNLYSEIFTNKPIFMKIIGRLSGDKNSNENEVVGITLGKFEDKDIF